MVGLAAVFAGVLVAQRAAVRETVSEAVEAAGQQAD